MIPEPLARSQIRLAHGLGDAVARALAHEAQRRAGEQPPPTALAPPPRSWGVDRRCGPRTERRSACIHRRAAAEGVEDVQVSPVLPSALPVGLFITYTLVPEFTTPRRSLLTTLPALLTGTREPQNRVTVGAGTGTSACSVPMEEYGDRDRPPRRSGPPKAATSTIAPRTDTACHGQGVAESAAPSDAPSGGSEALLEGVSDRSGTGPSGCSSSRP